MARGPARSMTKSVETLTHDEASRKNIPTAELQSFAEAEEAITASRLSHIPAPAAAEGRDAPTRSGPRPADYLERRSHPAHAGTGARARRDRETAIGDAQLVWRGKINRTGPTSSSRRPPLYPREDPPEGNHRRSPPRRQPPARG